MVEGACVGGGHELMLWCDLVISADDGVFVDLHAVDRQLIDELPA